MSLQDKIQIACRVLIKKELFREVAKKFRTSQMVIQLLIKKIENKPDLLKELVLQEKENVLRG